MLAVLATLAALAAPAPAVQPPDADATATALIVARQRALLLDDAGPGDIRFPAGDPAQWAATLRDDGTWADIDYQNRNGGAWPALEHLRRARVLARAAAAPPHAQSHDDDENAAAALRALAHWTAARHQNPNWWQNEIGVPQVMRDVIVLLDDRLQGAARDGAMAVLRQYKPQPPGFGANTVWAAELALMDGALSGDTAKVAAAARVIAGEITIGGAQGIQRDHSFFQHGARLQQFHYGRSFFTGATRLAWVLRGTPWEFPAGKIALLAGFAVEGCAWMCRGTATVPGALDRAASRPGALATAADLRREWALLAGLLPARAREFHAFREKQDGGGFSIFDLADCRPSASKRFGAAARNRMQNGAAAPNRFEAEGRQSAKSFRGRRPTVRQIENPHVPPLLTGFRAFPCADFAAYHCAEYSFFLKTVSTRTETTETLLRENKKGRKLNWGDHHLLRDGREYAALPPVWDWDLLPGVTSSTAITTIGRKPFAGAAGDGASGVMAMDYAAAGENGARVAARKFWAAHNGVIVALIGALDASAGGAADDDASDAADAGAAGAAPFRTALDQCLLRGPVTLAAGEGVFGVRRFIAALDGGMADCRASRSKHPAAPDAGAHPHTASPAGGAINRPVQSGDKSPHSKNTAAATTAAAATDAGIAGAAETIAMPVRRLFPAVRWLHHAGLLYVPLAPAPLTLIAGPATGSWRGVNENYPAAPVAAPVFLPVLEHGAAPRGAASGFAIQACASAAEADALAARPAWRVLRNDAACQAVRFDDGALMAVFYERGEISDDAAGGALLSAGQPCVALVSRGKLLAADPLRSGKPLAFAAGTRRLAVDCPPDGGVSAPLPINLP